MADEIEKIEGEVVEQQPIDIADTVQVEDIKVPNEDLDARLDALAGKKPNEALKSGKATEVQGKSATTSADGTGKKVEERPVAQEQRPSSERGYLPNAPRAYPKNYKLDANNNIVDANTGYVLTTTPAQRFQFERKMMPYIESIRAEADKYKIALDAANNANTVASSLKLSSDEYALGARIMAAYKADPKKAIDFLVKEAQNNGIDLSDIGMAGGGASVDAIRSAVKDIVAESIKPLLPLAQDREALEQDRENDFAAREGVNNFISQYPDAELHGVNIAKIMQHHLDNGQDISMREAYLILKNHALSNGLDWNKDLTPQVIAKVNSRTNPPNVNTNRRALPTMNGREGNGSVIPKPNNSAGGLASTDDIVKETMREFGMAIN